MNATEHSAGRANGDVKKLRTEKAYQAQVDSPRQEIDIVKSKSERRGCEQDIHGAMPIDLSPR